MSHSFAHMSHGVAHMSHTVMLRSHGTYSVIMYIMILLVSTLISMASLDKYIST